jgi:capsule polysaccharide modification protein KpsS
MAQEDVKVVRKSFTISELDVFTIKAAMRKCGYFSESEALRAIIKYFADNAPCLKTPPPEEPKAKIDDVLVKGR